MAPHAVRSYYNTKEARRRRFSVSPPRLPEDFEYYGKPIGKEAFFRSMGLRMKRVQYDKFFEKEETPSKRRKTDIPPGIHLRECSVVIQGVQCKLCGREFKCSTDLTTHMKSRHIIIEDNFGNDIYCDLSSETDTDASRIQDSSSPTLEQPKLRRKKGKKRVSRMRLVFKLGTEITGDLLIKRKHLKRSLSGKWREEISESRVAKENYEHIPQNALPFISQDKCVTNVTQTEVTDRVSISETPCKSVSDNESAYTNNGTFTNDIHRVYPYSITPPTACTITRVDNSADANNASELGKNLASVSSATKDVFSAQNKSGVQTCNNNSLPIQSIHRNLPRPVVTVTQSLTPVQTSPTTNSTSQANFNNLSITRVHESPKDALNTLNHPVFSSQNMLDNNNKFTKEILQNGSTEIRPNVFVKPVPREQRATFAGQPSVNSTEQLRKNPLTTIENLSIVTEYNTKLQETTSDDDDIQEIVRISRGKMMPGPIEINHESPNRADREILQVVDAISDMIRMEAQGLHLLGGKQNADSMKVTRISSQLHMKNLQQENVPQGLFGGTKMPNIQKTERHSFQSEKTKEKVPSPAYNCSSEAFQHYSFNYSSASPEIRCGNKMTSRYSQHSHSRHEPESKGSRAVILIDLVDD